jgi:DNA-binding transcriptional ArsR family regulator
VTHPRKKTRQAAPPEGEIDRWETHKSFVRSLADWTPRGLAAPLVWFVLWDWCDGKTGLIRGASIARLAKVTGMAPNTVRPALKALREKKLLTVEVDGKVPVYKLFHVRKTTPKLF